MLACSDKVVNGKLIKSRSHLLRSTLTTFDFGKSSFKKLNILKVLNKIKNNLLASRQGLHHTGRNVIRICGQTTSYNFWCYGRQGWFQSAFLASTSNKQIRENKKHDYIIERWLCVRFRNPFPNLWSIHGCIHISVHLSVQEWRRLFALECHHRHKQMNWVDRVLSPQQ